MKKQKVASIPGLDPTLPDVSIEIGGETYQLCYDFNAIAQVYAESGTNLFDGFSVTNPVSFRAMLWSALLRDRPNITIDQAGALITPKTTTDLLAKLLEVWGLSLPEPDGSKNPTEVQS